MDTLEDLVMKEQRRRVGLKRRNFPYRYWLEHGQPQPRHEVWCDQCVGFYSTDHTSLHYNTDGETYLICPHAKNINSGCECIDCECSRVLYGPGSLASKITQA